MSEEKTKEQLKLEEEFKAAYEEANERIQKQMDIAKAAIAKAEAISENYGVPFDASVSPISQTYTPASFEEKFGELDHDALYDEFEIIPGEYEGWEHSQVC